MRFALWIGLALVLALWSESASAYIGPGAGVGVLGAAIGVLIAILAALVIIMTWPVRVLLRRRRQPTDGGPDQKNSSAG